MLKKPPTTQPDNYDDHQPQSVRVELPNQPSELEEKADQIVFRCFAQGQYWGTERDGKLDEDYKPENPIDRTEAVKLILALLSTSQREAEIAILKKAHRVGGTTDFDNATDEYIDELIEQLTDSKGV